MIKIRGVNFKGFFPFWAVYAGARLDERCPTLVSVWGMLGLLVERI